jgi:hypothetical protein
LEYRRAAKTIKILLQKHLRKINCHKNVFAKAFAKRLKIEKNELPSNREA